MRDKRGVSLVIGYILLISIAIIMSILVYQWLKTYVPKDTPECADGTSVFIKELYYACTSGNEELSINIKNNGKFDVHGFFIHASNKTGEGIATIDLSTKLLAGGTTSGNAIVFDGIYLPPGKGQSFIFDIADYCPCNIPGRPLTKIEIIPTRIEEVEGKMRFVSCSEGKVEEPLTCLGGEEEEP